MTPEERKEYDKKYYAAHKEKKIATSTKWKKDHREETNAYERHRYATNPKAREKKAAWEKAHREERLAYFREYSKKRYAKQKAERGKKEC